MKQKLLPRQLSAFDPFVPGIDTGTFDEPWILRMSVHTPPELMLSLVTDRRVENPCLTWLVRLGEMDQPYTVEKLHRVTSVVNENVFLLA